MDFLDKLILTDITMNWIQMPDKGISLVISFQKFTFSLFFHVQIHF